MHKIDTKHLDQLLKEEKWEQARAEMDKFFKSDLSPEERGSIYFGFAQAYLRVNNGLMRQYEKKLDDLLVALKKIDKHGKETVDKINVKELRKKLAGK